jgi:hypothetical protein
VAAIDGAKARGKAQRARARLSLHLAVGAALTLSLAGCGPGNPAALSGGGVPPIGSDTTTGAGPTTSNAPSTTVGSTTGGTAAGTSVIPTTAPPSTPETSAPGATLSLLQRHDAPPADVSGIIGFYLGGAGPPPDCSETFRDEKFDSPALAVPGPEARTRWDTGDVRIGWSNAICVSHFREGPPIRLVVTGPSGIVIDQNLCSPCSGTFHWIPWTSFPGDPVGAHLVTASQENTEVKGFFRLLHGTAPLLYVDKSPGRDVASIRPGSTVRVGLSGYQPNTTVAVDMLHTSAAGSRYVTTLQARTDAYGEWLTSIPTRPDDPLGCYTFGTRPPVDDYLKTRSGRVNGFCLS